MAVASGCAWSRVSATWRPLSRAKSPDWLATTCIPGGALIASSKPLRRSFAGEARVDAAVEQDQGDARALGRHHRRNQRLLLARRQEDQVHALRDHAVDVG